MNSKEAQQFVADYVRGQYSPAGHAAFLRWLRGASIGEWTMIANEHEALYEQWESNNSPGIINSPDVPAEGPSPDWVVALEERLDRLEVKRKKAPVVFMGSWRKVRALGSKAWIAAASVAVVITSGVVWYGQKEGAQRSEERQAVLATLTHTTTVARGGDQRAITLPDGSTVWLNAESTLKYPATFSGKERVVELTGEGYFDVTQNSNMPFRVLFRDAEVKVLGTHFNIMAYNDEPESQTTLVDGSVRIESGSQRVTLHPGEQGEIPYPSPGARGPIRVIPGIDPTAIGAWRDGTLKFDNADLHSVMRTLGRCYNVDIQFGQNIPYTRITANYSRSIGLDAILKNLEYLYLHLHFINNGRTVTVTRAT